MFGIRVLARNASLVSQTSRKIMTRLSFGDVIPSKRIYHQRSKLSAHMHSHVRKFQTFWFHRTSHKFVKVLFYLANNFPELNLNTILNYEQSKKKHFHVRKLKASWFHCTSHKFASMLFHIVINFPELNSNKILDLEQSVHMHSSLIWCEMESGCLQDLKMRMLFFRLSEV